MFDNSIALSLVQDNTLCCNIFSSVVSLLVCMVRNLIIYTFAFNFYKLIICYLAY